MPLDAVGPVELGALDPTNGPTSDSWVIGDITPGPSPETVHAARHERYERHADRPPKGGGRGRRSDDAPPTDAGEGHGATRDWARRCRAELATELGPGLCFDRAGPARTVTHGLNRQGRRHVADEARRQTEERLSTERQGAGSRALQSPARSLPAP